MGPEGSQADSQVCDSRFARGGLHAGWQVRAPGHRERIGWDLGPGKASARKELPGHQAPVRAVCVSSRADKIWTADDGGQIRAWSVPDFAERGSISFENQSIAALALSPDGQVLACTGANGTARFYDARTGNVRGNHFDSSPGRSLAFINNGDDLVVARDRGATVIHLARPGAPSSGSSKSLKLVKTAPSGGEQILRTIYRPDGKALLLVKKDSVAVVEGDTGKEIRTWATDATVRDAAFGPNTTVYLLLLSGKLQAWDWQKGEMLHEYAGTPKTGPRPIRFCPTGDPRRLLVLTLTPGVWLWDTENWREVDRFTPYDRQTVIASASYPDGNRAVFVLGGAGGLRLVVWNVAKRREDFRLEPVEMTGLFRHEVSPNGKWILAISNENVPKMYIWDARDGKLRHTIADLPRASVSGGFTPGGDYYIACFFGGKTLTVDLAEGRVVEDYQPRIRHLRSDGAPAAGLFATADTDKNLRIWRFDIDTKPAGMVPSPSPKGTNVAKDKEGLLKESERLSDSIVGCAFSTDGKKIYAATRDGNVHVMNASDLLGHVHVVVAKDARFSHMSFVPKGQTSAGTATPERLYLLDESRKVYIFDPSKPTKGKTIDLEKASMKVKTIDQFVTMPTAGHLFAFDKDEGASMAFDLVRNAPGVPSALSRRPYSGATRCLAFTADARFGAAYASRKLLVWQVQSGRAVRTIDTGVSPRWLGLVEDANAVVAANRNQLFAWNYNTGKRILDVTDVHGRFIDFLAAAPLKGSHMVTAGGDHKLFVWDLTTGKRVAEWRMDLRADGLAMSPDGKFAITWHNGANSIALWGIPDSLTKKAAAIPKEKMLPISIAKVATAVSTKGLFDREDAMDQRLALDDWKPVTVEGVSFVLVDPKGTKAPNVILLGSRKGAVADKMPRSVSVPCNSSAKAIHLLGCVAGWALPYPGERGSVSMIVRLHYAGGKKEDHPLRNGEEIAEFVRNSEVPGSKFALAAEGGRQIRYLKIEPKEKTKIDKIEFLKGPDETAPVIMAVTFELP